MSPLWSFIFDKESNFVNFKSNKVQNFCLLQNIDCGYSPGTLTASSLSAQLIASLSAVLSSSLSATELSESMLIDAIVTFLFVQLPEGSPSILPVI